MYKTFELLSKALYIIVSWSIIFYVLEVRKFGTQFMGVALETLVGWLIFIAIIVVFVLFVASSHRQTKNTTKDKITKNVVEDGMVFTVGGHTKIFPVLPDAFLVESNVLNKFQEERPHVRINSDRLLRDLLKQPNEKEISISEEKLFKENEGGSEIYGDEDQRMIFNQTSNQSKDEIAKEASSNFHAVVGEFTDEHASRRIDKGILVYKYQFNLLLSHILNHELFELQENINKGLQTYSRRELETKRKEIKQRSSKLYDEIEQTLSKVLEALPNFKYRGIVTTTPEIRSRKEMDFKNYQLIIFTSLFPFIDWVSLRSNAALNQLDPELKRNLSSDEFRKLNTSELGLSLRDKRVLWNARRMYDIYVNRDTDVAQTGKSAFNMPVSFDAQGKMYNPLEETVALCEMLRFSQTIKSAKKRPANNNKKPLYTENDIIRLVYGMFSEKNRFNTSSAIDRIGIIKNELIYIDFDAFYPKFNGRFGAKYPHLANQREYQKAVKVFFDKLKKMGLLAMRIREENTENDVETFAHKTEGELLKVFWEFKEKNTITIDNTLIIHASQMFKDLLSEHQDYHANPKIIGVSQTRAIPLSNYAEKIRPLIEAANREQQRVKEIMESVKGPQQPEVNKSHHAIVSKMNESLLGQQQIPLEVEELTKNTQSVNITSKEEADPPTPINQPVQKSVTNIMDSLTDDETGLLDKILEASFSATDRDLGITNNILEQKTEIDVEDAFKYISREVQVLSLRKSDKEERAKGGGYRYAINEFQKNKLQLIHCSREAINDASLNLDFTILKVLDAARNNNYKAEYISHTTASEHVLISKAKIFTLFNVIEQMALYQKKGNGSFWSVKQEMCKAKVITAHSQQYNQISVIECLTIDQSKEEAIYKKIRETMWDKSKAQALFDEVYERLNNMDTKTQAKFKILKDPKSDLFLIPKQHLGQLRRTGVNVNSFLAYCEQFKNEMDVELQPYARNLTSIQIDGKSSIKFERI